MKRFVFLLMLLLTMPAQAAERSVLFIGNSYTYRNGMTGTVELLSKLPSACENPLEVKAITKGGASLFEVMRLPEAEQALQTKWDYVVLQDASWATAALGRSHFWESIQQLTQHIRTRSPKTEILLYETWSYREGHPNYAKFEAFNGTPQAAQKKINEMYESAAKQYDLTVIPIGSYFEDYRKTDKEGLFEKDGSHPSKRGSQLIALGFYNYFCKPPVLPESVQNNFDTDSHEFWKIITKK